MKIKDEKEIIHQQKNETKHQSDENQNHHHEEEDEECIHPYMSLYTPIQLPQSNNDINNNTTERGEKDDHLMDTTTIKTTENEIETKSNDVVEATYHIPNYPQQQNCIRQQQQQDGLENGSSNNNNNDIQHDMDDHDNKVGEEGGGDEENYAAEMYNQYATTVLQVATTDNNSNTTTMEINNKYSRREEEKEEDFESGGITFATSAMEDENENDGKAVAVVAHVHNKEQQDEKVLVAADTSNGNSNARGEAGSNADPKERCRREIFATTAKAIAESAERMINDEGWSIRYYELVGYYTLNNHSNVLRSDPNKRLSGWVKRQRNNFKAGKLSYTQIMLLNELDFVWNRLEHGWYEKYKMICNYSKQISNGHNCNVPCSYNRQLSEWTQKQRRDYGKKEKSMTSTRIDALEKVPGWTWTSQSQCKQQQPYNNNNNNNIKKVEQQRSSSMMMNIKNNNNQQQQQQQQSLENDIESSSDTEVDDVVI